MPRIAIVFPGQGSQYVGMGRDVYEAFPSARALFDEADDRLGLSLSSLCFSGPEESLNDTLNTQPAIFVTSMALWHAVQEHAGVTASWCAGHSLGEYAALVAAGALPFGDALQLVWQRGSLMQCAGRESSGGMAALLGLERSEVERLCRQASEITGGVVQIANDNAPGQVVISGAERSLSKAMEMALAAGARRAVRLAVSIAAHSPLMSPVVRPFRRAVESTPLQDPRIPVVANASATALLTQDAVADELVEQLTAPVRWVDSMRWLISQGADTFLEVGPGRVLTGLLKRIERSVRRLNVGTAADVLALGGM